MKWGKRLFFLTCCLRFLTHSGNENLYITKLSTWGNVTVTVPEYKNLVNKKQGHQNLGNLVAMAGLIPICLGNDVVKIKNMHQPRSSITEPSTSGFSSYSSTRATFAILLKVPVLIATP